MASAKYIQCGPDFNILRWQTDDQALSGKNEFECLLRFFFPSKTLANSIPDKVRRHFGYS